LKTDEIAHFAISRMCN